MKKIFTKFFLFAALLVASTNLSAQTYNGGTWYSLYDNEQEDNVVRNTSFCEKAVFTPAENIIFDYKKLTVISTNGQIQVQNKVNGSWSGSKGEVSVSSTSWKTSHAIALDANISHIRYYMKNSTGSSVRNHRVTLAKHIRLADGGFGTTSDSKSFGSVTIDGQSAAQKVTLRSFLTTGNITVTSSDNAFRINSASNLSGLTYAVGANACASANGQSGAQAGGATLGDINQYGFTIYFCPTEAKEYSATITITDGTSTATISVSGVGVKKTQQLTWAADFQADVVSLPVGEEIVNPATTNSGLALTYTSSDETVLAVEGTTIKALQAGEVTLTVEQAGDDNWNAVSATKTIKVTEKTIQFIHWIDNLTRLVVGGEPVQLTATAQILLDTETDEIQDAPERTALITYQSADDNVVTIDGTTLTIVGEGETTVTATLPGDDIYEATSISMPVRVRVPSTTCDSYVLEATDEFSIEYSLLGQVRIYEPAAFTAPGHILTFEARKQTGSAVGNIQIQQYVNGEWKDIDDANPGTDWRSYYYELDRKATKIRFYNGYGSYRRYFKNVLVSQATYLETTTPEITVAQSIIGDEITKTVAVQYSNIPAGTVVSNKSALVRLSDDEIDTDCGTYGEKQITLTCNPVAVGTINDTITIYEEVSGFTLTIPVAIHTQRNTQTIIWEDSVENILATDVVTFTATAENAITYTSSDSAIAYVSETNQLLIQSAGKVTITAYAAESETYESAQVSKEIVISKATPVITELPTVDPFGYGQTLEMIVLEGGTADVEGTFVWNADLTQILNAGTHEVAITFVPTVNTIYNAVDTIVTVQVDPIAQTIEWNAKDTTIKVSEVIYLSELCDAVATSGLAIQYIYSEDWANFVTYNEVTDEVTGIKEGVIIITATQDGMDNGYQNYLVAEPVSRKLTIVAEGGTSTNVDNIQSGNLSTYKKIINGQIVIIRGEQMYDIQGRVIR